MFVYNLGKNWLLSGGIMWLHLIERQKSALSHYFESIDLESVTSFVEHLGAVFGSIIWTGVGKSGHVGAKIASTMASTGTPSFFLPPAEALHGDLGRVRKGDFLIVLSKSGESEELLPFIEAVKRRGVGIAAVVSKRGSRLGKIADREIVLPVLREICPFDLAPTTSSAIQLLFGDLLAIALMEKRRFPIDAYGENHPGGAIGKKVHRRVFEVMLQGEMLPLAGPDDLLGAVLPELSAKRSGCLLVEEGGFLQGIFTDGDLRRILQAHGKDALELPLKRLMTKSARVIGQNALAIEAMRQMEEEPSITALPVVEEGRIVGLVRLHDILQQEILR